MLELKKIELSDKQWIDPLLKLSDFRGCEYNFTNNFVWSGVYNITVGRFQDFYVSKHGNCFVFPAGKGDTDALLSELKNYCDSTGIPFEFCSMDIKDKQMLEQRYPGMFTFDTSEDLYDYVYQSQSLATLGGKKLHSKRNYINRFKQLNWSFEDITPENIDECKQMSLEWCIRNDCNKSEDKSEEMCAVGIGLEHFFDLGLVGGILRVDGRIQAFSYGEQQCSDTFVTHVEKAFTDYDGAYPMINYMKENMFCKGLEYINREEDMGEENLRKAKKSYHPCFMVEKFSAVYNAGKGQSE